jgi:hypothetical protein
VSVLLDSNVVIDFLRGRHDANSLIEGLSEPPFVSVLTIMEIHAGLKGGTEEQRAVAFFRAARHIGVDAAMAALAGDFRRKYRPSHGLDAVDALIAAAAIMKRLPLLTLNTKHFPMVYDVRRPY